MVIVRFTARHWMRRDSSADPHWRLITRRQQPVRVAFSRDKRLALAVFVDPIAPTIKPSVLLRHSICKGAPSFSPLFSNPFFPSGPAGLSARLPASWCFPSVPILVSFFRFAPCRGISNVAGCNGLPTAAIGFVSSLVREELRLVACMHVRLSREREIEAESLDRDARTLSREKRLFASRIYMYFLLYVSKAQLVSMCDVLGVLCGAQDLARCSVYKDRRIHKPDWICKSRLASSWCSRSKRMDEHEGDLNTAFDHEERWSHWR